MKTYSPKLSEIKNDWFIIDAKDVILGRLAVLVATRLRGKHKPSYTPHMADGDNIIIINADKVKTTGNKLTKNLFYWHTGFPGGIKEKTWKDILIGKNPERLIKKAVERMMPKGPLSRANLRKLYIYASDSHPHEAQSPVLIDTVALNPKNKR